MLQKIKKVLLDNCETVTIFLLYSAAYVPMALNGWFFLDDPVTSGYLQNFGSLLCAYTEIGWFLAWPAYLHAFLFLPGDQAGIFLERSLIFFLYLGAAVCLNSALKALKQIGRHERLFVVLLFAVLPVNTARIAVSNLNYAVSYFLFFLGSFYLAAYLRQTGKTHLRLAALAAFFVSFSTNSLLVFYIAVPLFIFLVEFERSGSGLVQSLKRAPAYADFIMLPVVFWIVMRVFFVPYGIYAKANQVTIQGLFGWIELLPLLYTYLKAAVCHGALVHSLATVFAALFLTWWVEKIRPEEETGRSPYAYLPPLLAGALLIFAGAFPYLAVHKFPQELSWNSRHALLLPLGISLMLVYGTVWLVKIVGFPRIISTFMLSLMTLAYANASNHTYSRFLWEWLKQAAIVEHLRANDTVKNGNTIIFDDQIKEQYDGYPQESYRFFIWSAMMRLAFNDQTRGGFNLAGYPGEMEDARGISNEYRSRYFIADYAPGGKTVKVSILPSISIAPEIESRWRVIKLLTGKLPPEKLKTLIQVKCTPLRL